jgi:hypothetical protein
MVILNSSKFEVQKRLQERQNMSYMGCQRTGIRGGIPLGQLSTFLEPLGEGEE